MRKPIARNSWVILQLKKTSSPIIVPGGGVAEESGPMVVVSVGPGRYSDDGALIPMSAHVGDELLFDGGAKGRVIDGEKYWFILDETICGVVDGEEDAKPKLVTASDRAAMQ